MPIITSSGPVVSVDEAKEYGKIWRHGGLIVPLQDVHYEFAANFCSVMMKSFMQFVAQAAQKAVEEKQSNEIPTQHVHITDNQ